MSTVVLAHVNGVPLEELLSLAIPLGTCAAVGMRVAWRQLRASRR
ncbi:MAG: hypothetical protein ABW143_08240 [Acidimicrobiales bacterium]